MWGKKAIIVQQTERVPISVQEYVRAQCPNRYWHVRTCVHQCHKSIGKYVCKWDWDLAPWRAWETTPNNVDWTPENKWKNRHFATHILPHTTTCLSCCLCSQASGLSKASKPLPKIESSLACSRFLVASCLHLEWQWITWMHYIICIISLSVC